MGDKISTEIEVRYCDYDSYDIESTTISATIERDGDTVIIEAPGIKPRFSYNADDPDAPLILTVGELHNEVAIYRDSTSHADVDTDAGTVDVTQLNHDGMYVEKLYTPALADLLAEMEAEARDDYLMEYGIETVAKSGVIIPDVDLMVKCAQAAYPSSKTGRNSRPVEKLVVCPVNSVGWFDTLGTWGAWLIAGYEAGKRYESCAREFTTGFGSSVDNDELLFAPEGYAEGDRLTFFEWVDEWYLIDPREVSEIARKRIDEKKERREREAVIEEHPELRGLSFDPTDAREGFEEAAKTGTPVTVAHGGSDCNDPSIECSWDNISYRAMPNGKIERERIHTY